MESTKASRTSRAGRLRVADRGPGRSYRPDATPPTVFGEHQPGIATPRLDHLAMAALDLSGDPPACSPNRHAGSAVFAIPPGAARRVHRRDRLFDAG